MHDPRSPVAALMPGTGAAGLALLLVNSGFTVLKETPVFWRDIGGYPVALRELVLAGYYPLLGFNILLCLLFTGLAARDYGLRARCSWWAVSAGALMWLMLSLNIAWLTANNVENLLNGRQLHYHTPLPY